MARKNAPGTATDTAVEVITNVRNGKNSVDEVAFGQPEADLATYLGLDLGASLGMQVERAVSAYNQATRSMIEAGLWLGSVKQQLSRDDFLALLEQRKLTLPRAYELMRGATLAARLSPDQRDMVLAMPKTKVMALADASKVVVEAMLADDEVDIDLLSVRAMRQRIKDLEAELTDEAVRRETAETEAKGLRKKLDKEETREDKVPVVVADLRADLMANVRKAELAIESIGQLAPQLVELIGGPASDWADPTLRQAVSGVAHLGLLADGLLGRLCTALPDGTAEPLPRSFLTQQEIAETAEAWARLVGKHLHEQALRKHEREQKRPRGRGRPPAKPVLEG